MVNRYLSAMLAFAIAFAGLLVLTHTAIASNNAVDDVLAYERATCAAYQRNDAAAIDSLVADDYVLTESSGAVTTKADDIRDANGGAVMFSAFRNEDMRVKMYGNTAVVRGKTIVQGTARDGSKVDVIAQFMDTVVKINGRWRLVAGHVSRLKNS
ncbi:MAG: nuclear transport factor 2 family protein [Gemmatimonadaceae bacterium]